MTAAHTGPAPLETPDDFAERVAECDGMAAAIRARDAQWVAALEAMARAADGTREDHYDAGEAGQLPERMAELKGARDALAAEARRLDGIARAAWDHLNVPEQMAALLPALADAVEALAREQWRIRDVALAEGAAERDRLAARVAELEARA